MPSKYLVLALCCLAACTQWVGTPDLVQQKPLPVPPEQLAEVLQRITPPVVGDGTQHESHPSPRNSVGLLEAGDDLGYGVTMTPEAEELWAATVLKDWQSWESKFDAATKSLPDTPEAAFLLSAQRLRAMMHSGRIDEVRKELLRIEQIEREIFGNVLETTSQYAQLNSWLNNSYDSIAYNAAVVDAAGPWWLPEFYYAKPENTGDAKRVAGALMRSHIGLTCEHIVLHDYETAMAWGRAGLDMTESVLGISHHPLYGFFVNPTTYMYEGQAWMMACYAAARIGVSRNIEASQHLIDGAKAFLRQAQYRWGDYLVDSIVNYVLYDTGLRPQETARIGLLPEPPAVTSERLSKMIRFRPEDLQVREDVELPVPEAGSIELPGEGAVNAYGFVVGPELAKANAAILTGDYRDAIDRLDRIAATETDPLKRWQATEEAVKTLILAGQSAEAVERIADLEAKEEAFFGGNLGARALRGEAKFWLGDNAGALRDFAQVVEALGDFRPPSLLVFKPEVPQQALMTRAQYRAYLGIARSQMFAGRPELALPWAKAAEELFEEAHYTWQHQLYRRYLKLDADMFYARGVNLAVLAGAQLSIEQDATTANETMRSARAYLNAMEFDSGLITIEATWARALLDADNAALAEQTASKAAKFAVDTGNSDLLWQLQAMRGEALARLDKPEQAEKALRAAQAAIESVSGSLASDSSKRQFGIGKGDITRALVIASLERGDYAQAFADLERGRARAFVDMLGATALSGGRSSHKVERIRRIDANIREARILAALPQGRGRKAKNIITALERQRVQMISNLRRSDPEVADAFSIAHTSLETVQRRLGPRDLMIYTLPSDGDDQAIRFLAIQRGDVSLIETRLTHDSLEGALAIFTTDDPLGDATEQAATAERITEALNLSSWMPSGTLYVVPSRSLYFLPWGALPVDAPVVVLPNGGWIARTAGSASLSSAAVIGSPDLGMAWDPLPGTKEEATQVASGYGTQALIGPNATEEGLRKAIGKGVGVLHIATHGQFNARDPLASSILLSDAGNSDPLTAEELFENPLKANLVILSACETGLGRVSAGDDFLGLSRSFYLGGARAVMNSLWPVYDKPTRRFMEVFHSKARTGKIGNAWIAARDTLRAEGFPPSVYGAFVLGGTDML
ncbi:MAG: CHAT domain-containing protein [Pseudomonadota bacterium]